MSASKKSTKKASKKADTGAATAARSSSVSFTEAIKIPEHTAPEQPNEQQSKPEPRI